MYEYLTGRLAEARPDEVVLEVAGIGYRLAVSGATASRLPAVGTTVTLWAHHLVRDERLVLHGFLSREERALFERLLGVSKVGPAIALALLSALEPGPLAAAVDGGDVATLARVKGVGRRTAERLCVELKDRLDGIASPLPGPVTDRGTAVAAALSALGYPRAQARDAAAATVAEVPADTTLEALVKLALQRLRGASAAG